MTEPIARRLVSALWTERGRLLFSGLGALLLWFLLGQKVDKSEDIPVEVRCISAEQDWPQGSGLFIRLPPKLALSDVQPGSLELKVRGTAEEIARLDHSLRGTYQVPAGFLGEKDQATKTLTVDRTTFHFGQLKVSNLLLDSEEIALTLTKRHVENLTLNAANLSFNPPELGQGLQIDFEPTMIQISGPADQTRRVRENAALFQLTSINPEGFDAALRGRLKVSARLGAFDQAGRLLERMAVEDRMITITFTKKRRFRRVVLDDLEVIPMIPESALPEKVLRDRPLSLQPKTVKVTLQVPEAYFSAGSDEAALRKQLNVFVDLGEMPFDTAAENLPVHFEGFPEGATVIVEPALIDVTWNIPETPESKDDSNQ